MIIKSLKVIDGRNYINGKLLSHFVWNHYNPSNRWKKGMVIHHKDEDTLNDHISNLSLMMNGQHTTLHHKGKVGNWLGRHHSEETKKKLSESTKKYWAEKKAGLI